MLKLNKTITLGGACRWAYLFQTGNGLIASGSVILSMNPKNLQIKDFTYTLPEDFIAKFPTPQRDQSRLLYYREGMIQDHVFASLDTLLPAESLLVFNDTKVVQARLLFQKPTGGAVEIFCLEPVAPQSDIQLAMQQQAFCVWKCLVGNAKRWKTGSLDISLASAEGAGWLRAERVEEQDDHFLIRFQWEPASLAFAQVLELAGKTPLPPYFRRDSTPEDSSRYQTVYAAHDGAIAAPTAGLHFTGQVLERLEQKGIKKAYLTLHVGAGTFRPVKAELMKDHGMHAEEMYVSRDLIEEIRHQLPRPVIPVGTTSMRTLESLYWLGVKLHQQPQEEPVPKLQLGQWAPYESGPAVDPDIAFRALLLHLDRLQTDHLHASTQLLIAPGYDFKVCQALITNFHQPQSTLLLLVSAFIGPDWRKIYQHALENNYRFLSYGDSSLLVRNNWR
jgi:S-adenosylmethionine:tRNA ribosyltransferase-isomerase